MLKRFLEEEFIDEKVLEICKCYTKNPKEYIDSGRAQKNKDGRVIVIDVSDEDTYNYINNRLTWYLMGKGLVSEEMLNTWIEFFDNVNESPIRDV